MWLLLHHNSYFFSASLCWDWNQHLFVTISYPCKLSLTNSQNYIFCTWRHPTIFPVKPSMLLATADSTECRSFTGGSLCLGDCDPSSCFTSISWLPQLFLGNHTLASITIAHWRGIFYGFYFLFFTQARPPIILQTVAFFWLANMVGVWLAFFRHTILILSLLVGAGVRLESDTAPR